MIGRKELGTSFTAGSHGSTFGGNYVAMAAAEAVLQVSKRPSFLKEVQEKGSMYYRSCKRNYNMSNVFKIYVVRGLWLELNVRMKLQVL